MKQIPLLQASILRCRQFLLKVRNVMKVPWLCAAKRGAASRDLRRTASGSEIVQFQGCITAATGCQIAPDREPTVPSFPILRDACSSSARTAHKRGPKINHSDLCTQGAYAARGSCLPIKQTTHRTHSTLHSRSAHHTRFTEFYPKLSSTFHVVPLTNCVFGDLLH